MPGDSVTTGWKLDREDRARLLVRFPPHWPDVDADHVTLAADRPCGTPAPPEVTAEVVGSIDDGEGLQALIVAIDGGTDRPDGSTFHITWSLDRKRGREPIESNDVLARLGWNAVEPVPITLHPACF